MAVSAKIGPNFGQRGGNGRGGREEGMGCLGRFREV